MPIGKHTDPALKAKIFPVGSFQEFLKIASVVKAIIEQKINKNTGKKAIAISIFTLRVAEKTTIGAKI